VHVTVHIIVFDHIALSFLIPRQSRLSFFFFHNYESLGRIKNGFFCATCFKQPLCPYCTNTHI